MFICLVCVLKLSDIRAQKLLGCEHESAGGRPGQPGPRLGLHLRGGSPLRSLPRGLRLGRRHRRLPGGDSRNLEFLGFFNFDIDTTSTYKCYKRILLVESAYKAFFVF